MGKAPGLDEGWMELAKCCRGSTGHEEYGSEANGWVSESLAATGKIKYGSEGSKLEKI